jgi:hypothetical protein
MKRQDLFSSLSRDRLGQLSLIVPFNLHAPLIPEMVEAFVIAGNPAGLMPFVELHRIPHDWW